MTNIISFFVTGPNDTVQDKIDKIIKDHEIRNPRYKAFVKVISSTTENCAPGTTQHTYSLETKHVDDLKEEE